MVPHIIIAYADGSTRCAGLARVTGITLVQMSGLINNLRRHHINKQLKSCGAQLAAQLCKHFQR